MFLPISSLDMSLFAKHREMLFLRMCFDTKTLVMCVTSREISNIWESLLSDINECLLGASNCRGGERCINTEGSFRCQREVSCGTGYELTDNNNCKGQPNCHEFASVLLYWSHVCFLAADRVFHFLWFHSPDIDECETGIHNCVQEFECQNTQGSFRCIPKVKCGVGYIQDVTAVTAKVNSCVKSCSRGLRHPFSPH